MSGFFSLKSQAPKELIANAVYKYTCLCDTSLTYIGKTKQHLAVRSEDHFFTILSYSDQKPINLAKISSIDSLTALVH